jgi:hypothetical protein
LQPLYYFYRHPAGHIPPAAADHPLEREGAPPGALLEELRGLVLAAEAWAKLEGDERARAAVERCDAALPTPVA